MTLPQEPLKGALLQLTSLEGFEQNWQQIQSLLSDVNLAELDLIVLPENAFFFRVTDAIESYKVTDEVWRPVQEFSNQNQLTLIVGGAPIEEGEQVFNATVVFSPGKPPYVAYRKIHLFDVDVEGSRPLRESDQFHHGEEPAILEIGSWRLGLSICYDIRFSELYKFYADQEVHGLLVPAAFLVPTGKAHWQVLNRARAIECQAFVLSPAQAGLHKVGEKTRKTYGHSLVIDPWGEVLSEGDGSTCAAIEFELEPEQLQKVRSQIPMSQHRRL